GSFALVQDLVDLFRDRHVDTHLCCLVVNAAGRVNALGYHAHARQNLRQLLTPSQALADMAIAPVAADASSDQVAQSSKAIKRLVLRSQRHSEASYFNQAARH